MSDHLIDHITIGWTSSKSSEGYQVIYQSEGIKRTDKSFLLSMTIPSKPLELYDVPSIFRVFILPSGRIGLSLIRSGRRDLKNRQTVFSHTLLLDQKDYLSFGAIPFLFLKYFSSTPPPICIDEETPIIVNKIRIDKNDLKNEYVNMLKSINLQDLDRFSLILSMIEEGRRVIIVSDVYPLFDMLKTLFALLPLKTRANMTLNGLLTEGSLSEYPYDIVVIPWMDYKNRELIFLSQQDYVIFYAKEGELQTTTSMKPRDFAIRQVNLAKNIGLIKYNEILCGVKNSIRELAPNKLNIFSSYLDYLLGNKNPTNAINYILFELKERDIQNMDNLLEALEVVINNIQVISSEHLVELSSCINELTSTQLRETLIERMINYIHGLSDINDLRKLYFSMRKRLDPVALNILRRIIQFGSLDMKSINVLVNGFEDGYLTNLDSRDILNTLLNNGKLLEASRFLDSVSLPMNELEDMFFVHSDSLIKILEKLSNEEKKCDLSLIFAFRILPKLNATKKILYAKYFIDNRVYVPKKCLRDSLFNVFSAIVRDNRIPVQKRFEIVQNNHQLLIRERLGGVYKLVMKYLTAPQYHLGERQGYRTIEKSQYTKREKISEDFLEAYPQISEKIMTTVLEYIKYVFSRKDFSKEDKILIAADVLLIFDPEVTWHDFLIFSWARGEKKLLKWFRNIIENSIRIVFNKNLDIRSIKELLSHEMLGFDIKDSKNIIRGLTNVTTALFTFSQSDEDYKLIANLIRNLSHVKNKEKLVLMNIILNNLNEAHVKLRDKEVKILLNIIKECKRRSNYDRQEFEKAIENLRMMLQRIEKRDIFLRALETIASHESE